MSTLTASAELEAFYQAAIFRANAMSAHLSRLRALAAHCEAVAEFGVNKAGSSSALLLGAQHVTSVDLVLTEQARRLKAMVGDRWTLIEGNSLTVTLPAVELLFIDSLHTFEHVQAELAIHADRVSRYLVLHDTITFGSVGARGETGEQQWAYVVGQSVPHTCLGIRPAIDQLMIRDPSWRILASYTDSHGLLVLGRR